MHSSEPNKSFPALPTRQEIWQPTLTEWQVECTLRNGRFERSRSRGQRLHKLPFDLHTPYVLVISTTLSHQIFSNTTHEITYDTEANTT